MTRDDVSLMLNAMPHRGPDGSAVWAEGDVAFGHAMLCTTLESLSETLPYAIPDGNVVLTADARIDNRAELIATMPEYVGAHSRVITDSDLILWAYQTWGECCVEHLIGDFAFAIYDAPKEGIFCARDHFGVKPFYYALTDRQFAFATEQKALLVLDWVDVEVNVNRIGEFIVSLALETQSTFYQGIARLAPAHTMFVGRTSVHVRRYWELDATKELRLDDDAAYAKRFRQLFDEAVRCRLRSAAPVGAFLSGGLDSSSIVSVASDALAESGECLRTFSLFYSDVPECDERPYIEKTLNQSDAKPFFLDASGKDPFENLVSLTRSQDEPIYGVGTYSTAWLYHSAADVGVRVVLDGHDGDSTVSHSFGHLTNLAKACCWKMLWSHCKRLGPAYRSTPWKLFWTYFEPHALRPVIDRSAPLRWGRRAWLAAKRRVRAIAGKTDAPRFGTALSHWDVLSSEVDGLRSALKREAAAACRREGEFTNERQEHCSDLTHAGQPWALESLDKAAAQAHVEPRYPFWDLRLVEFCVSVPVELKLREGWSRWILRAAMEGILPPEIQWRSGKTDFSAAVYGAADKLGRQSMQSLIESDDLTVWKYLDRTSVRSIYSYFLQHPSLRTYRVVYAVVAILSWSMYYEHEVLLRKDRIPLIKI